MGARNVSFGKQERNLVSSILGHSRNSKISSEMLSSEAPFFPKVCLCSCFGFARRAACSSERFYVAGMASINSKVTDSLFYIFETNLEILSFSFLTGQPPWDLDIGKKFIIHYTYGCDYNLKVKLLCLCSFFSIFGVQTSSVD